MARLTASKRTELESFWQAHLEAWRRSDLNQRECCELHGLPLKRFGNWRAKRWFFHPSAIGRIASLLATAKLNDVEPCAYLKNVLECVTHSHPMRQIDDLLPWKWKASTVAI